MPTLSNCNVDKLSYSVTSEHVSVPEPTELDRMLIRVTEAALDATLNMHDDLNANNEAQDQFDHPHPPAPPPRKGSKAKSIGRRFRSLFSLGQRSARASAARVRKLLPRLYEEPQSNQEETQYDHMHVDFREHQRLFQEKVEGGHRQKSYTRGDPDGNNNQGWTCGGGCRSGAAAVSPTAQLDKDLSPGPQLINLSNTSETSPSPANSSATRTTPGSGHKSQPGNKDADKSPTQTGQTGTASTALTRSRVYRGGPTTQGNRQKQEALFRECRIVPTDTLYKKTVVASGQERLFVSRPTNFRTSVNPKVYDIAYENFRHHSDCNRDFLRVNLKKICSTYIKPTQFRYTY